MVKSQTKLLEKLQMGNFCQWSMKCGVESVHNVYDFQLFLKKKVSGIYCTAPGI